MLDITEYICIKKLTSEMGERIFKLGKVYDFNGSAFTTEISEGRFDHYSGDITISQHLIELPKTRVIREEQRLLLDYSALIGYSKGVFSTLIDHWDLPKDLTTSLKQSLTRVEGHEAKLDKYFNDL